MSSGDEVYPEDLQVFILFKGWIMRGYSRQIQILIRQIKRCWRNGRTLIFATVFNLINP